MLLRVIGTGSKGNCYALSDGSRTLLLDAGLPTHEIARAVDMRRVVGCLVTHEHQDHIKGASGMIKRGIPCYMSEGTAKGGDLTGYKLVSAGKQISLDGFTVLPFEAQHDSQEPLGYLIRSKATRETVLYATDTYYLRYTFPGVNYWIIECNYCDSLLAEAENAALRKRLLHSHMSLNRLLDLFRANDLSHTRSIVLVHLSDERSNEAEMIERVKEVTGIAEVVAADNGIDIQLNLIPF